MRVSGSSGGSSAIPQRIPALATHVAWSVYAGAVYVLLVAAMRREIVPPAKFEQFNELYFAKDTKYTPLIRPEDKPAIDLNTEILEKYRPAMKKYYYDPTKYKTYLEQLGIQYPTVRK